MKRITVHHRRVAIIFSLILLILSKIPFLRRLLSLFFEVSGKEPWRRAFADIFDWYTAPVTTFHDEDEIVELFKRTGFKDIAITTPNYRSAVNIIGRKIK